MNSVSSEIKDMTFQNDPNAYNQHWDNGVPQ